MSREERTAARRNRSPAANLSQVPRQLPGPRRLSGAAKRQVERKRAAQAAAATAVTATATAAETAGKTGSTVGEGGGGGRGDSCGVAETRVAGRGHGDGASKVCESAAPVPADCTVHNTAAERFRSWTSNEGAVAAATAAAATAAALLKRGEVPFKQDEADNAKSTLSGLATVFRSSPPPSPPTSTSGTAEEPRPRKRPSSWLFDSPTTRSGVKQERGGRGRGGGGGDRGDGVGGRLMQRSMLTISARGHHSPSSSPVRGKRISPTSSPLPPSTGMWTPAASNIYHTTSEPLADATPVLDRSTSPGDASGLALTGRMDNGDDPASNADANGGNTKDSAGESAPNAAAPRTSASSYVSPLRSTGNVADTSPVHQQHPDGGGSAASINSSINSSRSSTSGSSSPVSSSFAAATSASASDSASSFSLGHSASASNPNTLPWVPPPDGQQGSKSRSCKRSQPQAAQNGVSASPSSTSTSTSSATAIRMEAEGRAASATRRPSSAP